METHWLRHRWSKKLLQNSSQESSHPPLTDDEIQNRLQDQGNWIVLHTVIKYRQKQRIQTSHISKFFSSMMIATR